MWVLGAKLFFTFAERNISEAFGMGGWEVVGRAHFLFPQYKI